MPIVSTLHSSIDQTFKSENLVNVDREVNKNIFASKEKKSAYKCSDERNALF